MAADPAGRQGTDRLLQRLGGQPEINAYLVWAGQEIARQYQVELVQVKVDDIAQSVSQLLAGKQAGKTSNGPIDLLWVNGENFKALKEQGLLGAPLPTSCPTWPWWTPPCR